MAVFPFQSGIDWTLMAGDARDVARRLSAVSRTMADAGTGEVIVSIRRKMAGESRAPFHGRLIANVLRSRGHDPFEYEPAALAEAEAPFRSALAAAPGRAYETGSSQEAMVRAAIERMAEALAAAAIERIRAGRLGANDMTYARRKRRAIERRHPTITTEHGSPPPYGVWSGRFVAGIRARWRRGRA